jgi:hypothetical protein
LKNQTVVIRDGIIDEIGLAKNLKIPKEILVVDGSGKFLMPGLVDMHAHLPGNEGELYDIEEYMFLNISQGVTTLRSMRGAPEQIEWREKIKSGSMIGPDLYLASPVLTWDSAFTVSKARELIPQYKRDGYDLVKYLTGLSSQLFDTVVEICKKNNIILAGHAPEGGLKHAVMAGQTSVEHIHPFIKLYSEDSVVFWSTIKEMSSRRIFNCPDVFWYYVYYNQLSQDDLMKLPGVKYVSGHLINKWQQDLKFDSPEFLKYKDDNQKMIYTYLKNLKRMSQEGVPLLVSGGDGAFIIPGFSMYQELKIFTNAGLTTYEALRAATKNAADYFGEGENWGVIKKNAKSNLIMLDKNPLLNIDYIQNPEGVMVNGKWYSKKDIDQKLNKLEEKYKK